MGEAARPAPGAAGQRIPERFVRVEYTIEFLSPFRIGTGYGGPAGLDATAVRQVDGNLYIPGSTVKGRLRWMLGKMLGRTGHDSQPCDPAAGEDPCYLCSLLGSVYREGEIFFADAGLARDFDLVRQVKISQPENGPRWEAHELAALRTRSQVERRSQVSLSRGRRTALDRHLTVQEVGQAGLRFHGEITGMVPPDEALLLPAPPISVPVAVAWVVAALRAINQMGARKSSGLGHCTISVTQVALTGAGQESARVNNPEQLIHALQTISGSR